MLSTSGSCSLEKLGQESPASSTQSIVLFKEESQQKPLLMLSLYRTYYIRDGQSDLPFVFNDIMGLESGESQGADPEDIVKSLEGLLKEGHKFNPGVSAKKEDCRSKPSAVDQTHCLVYVIAADKVSMMDDDVFRKMRFIRQKASELGE
ncbi:hypothetical protein Q8A67_017050 [Cirrhinus molitorella]|uniref:Uncharacterized protein n=1 Tax=Cirrhinus molitorella TaxID=172907 RepID=A0AA88PHF6_9TELE|nr:hypothetical protein Q8A67_017050 [Cirrhinus molitorella]